MTAESDGVWRGVGYRGGVSQRATTPQPPNEPLDPALPADLATSSAYPGDPSAADGVTEVQTHLSYVFLTGERVYKLKKSIDVGFASFLTQHARNENCVRELTLNRRLSPDVYLGVARVERELGGTYRVGDVDPAPAAVLPAGEHCLVMRRLPSGRDAGTLLDSDSLPPAWLEATARRIAAFHAQQRLGTPSPFTPEAWRDRIREPVEANFTSLEANRNQAVLDPDLEALRTRARGAFDRSLPSFEARRLAGRAVDGHGDLHLEHVWFEGDDATAHIIDCLEFDDELRRVDAASEVAFLAMDLGFRGRRDLAERWLSAYADAADDFHLYTVVDYFESYRAAVRAKVETIASRDPRIPEAERRAAAVRARERVAFATAALEERPAGRLYLVGGLIGAGKSSVARILAEATQGVVISSDRVRQHDAQARSQGGADGGFAAGRYAPAARERIYDEMLLRAHAVVASGRPAVLDASWASARTRERVRRWALEQGSQSVFVEARCGKQETLARLARRQREGRDASEAGPEIYDRFAASFDDVRDGEWPAAQHWTIHTDDASWRGALDDRLRDER